MREKTHEHLVQKKKSSSPAAHSNETEFETADGVAISPPSLQLKENEEEKTEETAVENASSDFEIDTPTPPTQLAAIDNTFEVSRPVVQKQENGEESEEFSSETVTQAYLSAAADEDPPEEGDSKAAANSPAFQLKSDPIQRKIKRTGSPTPSYKPNETGLPDDLKTGIENLSGYSMDDVNVHYNSSQPSQMNAHAYAQGTDIHVAQGQEQHLPHEAWHVVQQKQGRVKPTMQMKGMNVNDDVGLEKEADVMGAKALKGDKNNNRSTNNTFNQPSNTAQLLKKKEVENISANGLYMTKKGEPEVLYSKHDAPPPRPTSLYIQSTEWNGIQIGKKKLKKWEPNVRLFSRGEKQRVNKIEGDAEDAPVKVDMAALYEIVTQKEQEIEAGFGRGADWGILGPNDCFKFASTLNSLLPLDPSRAATDSPIDIGTQFKLEYNEISNNCAYHSITVVATDAISIITLAAHAGYETNRPRFAIYEGKEGFEKDASPDSGFDKNIVTLPIEEFGSHTYTFLRDNYDKSASTPERLNVNGLKPKE